MRDILLPKTDFGVLVQLLVLGLGFAALLRFAWSRPNARLIVIGVGLILLGLFGLRAIH